MMFMLPFASDFLLIVSLADFLTLKNMNLMLVDLEFDSFYLKQCCNRIQFLFSSCHVKRYCKLDAW